MLRSRRPSSRGFSLVEIAMTLAIVAVLVAGTMLFVRSADTASRTRDTMAQVVTVQAAVRSLYHSQASYAGLEGSQVANSRMVPAKWVRGTGAAAALVSPFSTAVTLVPSADGSGFTLTVAALPGEACSKIAAVDMGTALVALRIGTVTVPARAMTPAESRTACSSPTSNDVSWDLR